MRHLYKLFAYTIAMLMAVATPAFADTTHRVKKGETLSEIARAYRVSIKSIKDLNNLKDADAIRIGQKLTIPVNPPKFVSYTIRSGDSLSNIAQAHGVSMRELSTFNGISNPDKIRIGQVIKIPIHDAKVADASRYAALTAGDLATLRDTKTNANQWKHIVIHHSATRTGSFKSLDRYHREERRMENGLAYHFLIGNGRGMGDGELHIGNRWKQQLHGGHLSSYPLNKVSIGICLVGDFERTRPSRKQMEQLEALIKYLIDTTSLTASNVTTHTLIHPKHTVCPGKRFPIASLKSSLEE